MSPISEESVHDYAQPDTLAQALALFETVGMPARNMAMRTRTEYKKDLLDLIRFLDERLGTTELAKVGLRDLEAYQAELDRRGLKASSRQRKTHAIKSLFNFLLRNEIITQNPALKLVPPPAQRKDPRFLSEQEYKSLLLACRNNSRDAAIIEVLLQTGMRLAELAGLKLNDVELPAKITTDPDNTGFVKVRRKGGKLDLIPLNHKACRALAAYKKVRPKVEHSAFFVSKNKTGLAPRDIQRMVAKYLAEAKIEGASVHTLRHTMATHLVAKGADLKSVQETLGHTSLDTTSIYVSLAKKQQRKVLQEFAL